MDISTPGKRIKYLRLEQDISIDDLSKKIAQQNGDKTVSPASISKIENDKNLPSAEALILFSDYFGVSIDWLLRGREFESRTQSFATITNDNVPPPFVRSNEQPNDELSSISLGKLKEIVEEEVSKSDRRLEARFKEFIEELKKQAKYSKSE